MNAQDILLARLDQRVEEAKNNEKIWAKKLVEAAKSDDDVKLTRVSRDWLLANTMLNYAISQRQAYVDHQTLGISLPGKS